MACQGETEKEIVGDLVGPLLPSYDIGDGPVDNENIYRRNGGCGVVAEGKLYVWGGEGAEQRLLDCDSSEEEEEFTTPQVGGIWCVTVLPPPRILEYPFDVLDMTTCTWYRQKTSGNHVPLLGLGSSLNFHNATRTIYLFGGWNYGSFDSEVYGIVLDIWKWSRAEIKSTIKPTGRYLTGTLVYDNRLCTFGGSGINIVQGKDGSPQDPGSCYEQTYDKGEGYGRNNEYYEFDMITCEWSVHLGILAERPNPLSSHCFVRFDSFRAILFGGISKDGQMNETRIFNLRERIFSEPLKFSEPLPAGRSFATMTPLIDPLPITGQGSSGSRTQQKILLLWGKDNLIFPDSWILDLNMKEEEFSWTQVSVNTYARAWHIAGALYSQNSSECCIAIFGGNVHWNGFVGKRRNIGDVRMALFGISSLSRLCARAIARESGDIISFYMRIFPPHSPIYIALEEAKMDSTYEKLLQVTEHCYATT